ncbi:MAG: T9SS type A sorting domain-containing protein [Bacteroidales bacterium]|nr:T9SS type A sorting domain-containing protein [Bacteroidales bacterium]
MKKVIFFIILLPYLNSYSQSWYDVNFDDSSQLYKITIDTTLNPNNIWQIGVPQKSIFNSAYSFPNVIVTDTINSYPSNDTSIFYITHIADYGFVWNHTVILSGYYKSDSDSLNDFGLMEFSPDKGETWINLVNDSIYDEYLSWYSEKPVLTGRTPEWTYFYVSLVELGYVFNFEIGDTLYYKFSFISNGDINQMDGLMYDDLHFEDSYEIIDENSIGNIKSVVFPNPAVEGFTIEYENKENTILKLSIYDIYGKQLFSQHNIFENKILIDTREFPSGLYFYKLFDSEIKQQSCGKFVIEK